MSRGNGDCLKMGALLPCALGAVRRNFKNRAERRAERERHREVTEQRSPGNTECCTQGNSATVAHFVKLLERELRYHGCDFVATRGHRSR